MANAASLALGAPEIAGAFVNPKGMARKPVMLGLKTQVADQVLARSPRSDIDRVDWDEGRLLSHLRIAFAGGGSWEFDVPKVGKQAAREVARVLRT